ncbi:FtsX-like permease family protein [Nonomuraea turcica]|uniref:FtsX-like permease family protein n=1 Tax=Nonomuraea sp. G32 TaxID=3067274 RepID=UPI00273B4EB4|nr:FtsX-like permease family protein [Nonomuraea sp. G32]MDP4503422.1 FtsX-like permease family protein [Nonomuraea sp. G32]
MKRGLAYGLLAVRRRSRLLALPAATVATGAFLLVLVMGLLPGLRAQAFGDMSRASVVIAVLVLLVGAVEVAIAATRSVVQRTREIGVLNAFGVPYRAIVWGLLAEPVAIAASGAAAGALLGLAATAGLALTGPADVPFLPGVALLGALAAVCASTLAAAAASAVPAWRAARRPPLASLTD